MITATLTTQPDGAMLIEHPNAWTRKPVSNRSFTANVRGRRIDVYVGMIDSRNNLIHIPLYYFNGYREAEDNDERTGQNVIASHPADCVRWIKAYVPRGPERDRLLEFFAWLHPPLWNELRQPIIEQGLAQFEEDRRIESAMWYANEEARMNTEAAELEREVFPVEIVEDEP